MASFPLLAPGSLPPAHCGLCGKPETKGNLCRLPKKSTYGDQYQLVRPLFARVTCARDAADHRVRPPLPAPARARAPACVPCAPVCARHRVAGAPPCLATPRAGRLVILTRLENGPGPGSLHTPSAPVRPLPQDCRSKLRAQFSGEEEIKLLEREKRAHCYPLGLLDAVMLSSPPLPCHKTCLGGLRVLIRLWSTVAVAEGHVTGAHAPHVDVVRVRSRVPVCLCACPLLLPSSHHRWRRCDVDAAWVQ